MYQEDKQSSTTWYIDDNNSYNHESCFNDEDQTELHYCLDVVEELY